jgi:hypothetical protein
LVSPLPSVRRNVDHKVVFLRRIIWGRSLVHW